MRVCKKNKFEFLKVVDREKPGCLEAISKLEADFVQFSWFPIDSFILAAGALFFVSLFLAINFFMAGDGAPVWINVFCVISFLYLIFEIRDRMGDVYRWKYRNAVRECLSHLTDYEMEIFDIATDDSLNLQPTYASSARLPPNLLEYLKKISNQKKGQFLGKY